MTTEELPGSDWLDWLLYNDRFLLAHSMHQRFVAHKTINGYWFAHRIMHQRVRTNLLGVSSDLCCGLLELAAINISLPDNEYWVDCANYEFSTYPVCSPSTSDVTMQLIDEYMRAAHGLNTIPPTEQWDSLKKFRDWVSSLQH
ncbi:MAG: hypothetical protein F6K63_35445 [Moorea sp. SIO1G6]|uniref:hypothetical protein n=1 Tax=Moorena sp. SIO1G6 TaxID=2607840 RepID=UPI0013C22BF0|nr:hypothetical protein [Moorena sp. SIO1G6]NET69394.1 hypothetical protein [Moorena sp. SIO1G6]